MSRRRVFDIDFPEAQPEAAPEASAPVPAGTRPPKASAKAPVPPAARLGAGARDGRRGPMAAAIQENSEALRQRQSAEAQIRAENDRLAHEFVGLRRLGLVIELVPLDQVKTGKLTRDRAPKRDPEIDELKDSIRALGLSNPIRVEASGEGHELVQGLRRLTAFRELLAETGDVEAYGRIPAALTPQGETLEGLYRRMVDENLVRRDISFAEMAALARAYHEDPQTNARSLDEAIATLFGSAGRQKRVYIRNFAHLLERVGEGLRHPEAMPRALGLATLKRLEAEEGGAKALLRTLRAAPADRGEEEEMGLLRLFAEGGAAALGLAVEAEAGRTPAAALDKREVNFLWKGRGVRCAAARGRLELRTDRDFTALSPEKLERAARAFFKILDAEG
ncbi:ParB/RepB/Spo0J family partition protein [Neomegalonema sp.]|uniref:ParB/RepB/Spo0J family partition protein n=1 Tax=Neomegalonema sp. TaxID=2039713 RepID=UPI002601C80E|nr:ParB/RepB/Spo0J family partition protein [Neomegalonema sp.]MDD2869213.1 ParB/RepB/Spo0J family partition protein [Neomegalonema sp.]